MVIFTVYSSWFRGSKQLCIFWRKTFCNSFFSLKHFLLIWHFSIVVLDISNFGSELHMFTHIDWNCPKLWQYYTEILFKAGFLSRQWHAEHQTAQHKFPLKSITLRWEQHLSEFSCYKPNGHSSTVLIPLSSAENPWCSRSNYQSPCHLCAPRCLISALRSVTARSVNTPGGPSHRGSPVTSQKTHMLTHAATWYNIYSCWCKFSKSIIWNVSKLIHLNVINLEGPPLNLTTTFNLESKFLS